MPSKKKKYNARFPAGRIKKIMQTDEEVGKVAQAVPIIISRTLELFVESLLTKTMMITESRNAKTLTPSHLKQCIQSESRFDFLKDLVQNIPDASVQEDTENNAIQDCSDTQHNYNFPAPSPSVVQPSASAMFGAPPAASTIVRTPVIQYQPRLDLSSAGSDVPKVNISVGTLIQPEEPKIKIEIGHPVGHSTIEPPPLVPISTLNYANSNTGDNLYIDEDYDN